MTTLPPTDDWQDVRAAQDGDANALFRFLDRHRTSVKTHLRELIPASEQDDFLQDLFVQALRKIHNLRSGFGLSPRSWLLMFARAYAIDRNRRNRTKKSGYGRTVPLEEALQSVATDHRTSEDHESQKTISRILSVLEPQLRVIARLSFLDGLSPQEIELKLGVSARTVSRQLVRIRRNAALIEATLLTGLPYATDAFERFWICGFNGTAPAFTPVSSLRSANTGLYYELEVAFGRLSLRQRRLIQRRYSVATLSDRLSFLQEEAEVQEMFEALRLLNSSFPGRSRFRSRNLQLWPADFFPLMWQDITPGELAPEQCLSAVLERTGIHINRSMFVECFLRRAVLKGRCDPLWDLRERPAYQPKAVLEQELDELLAHCGLPSDCGNRTAADDRVSAYFLRNVSDDRFRDVRLTPHAAVFLAAIAMRGQSWESKIHDVFCDTFGPSRLGLPITLSEALSFSTFVQASTQASPSQML